MLCFCLVFNRLIDYWKPHWGEVLFKVSAYYKLYILSIGFFSSKTRDQLKIHHSPILGPKNLAIRGGRFRLRTRLANFPTARSFQLRLRHVDLFSADPRQSPARGGYNCCSWENYLYTSYNLVAKEKGPYCGY